MKQIRISAWAIRNPTPVSLLFIALMVLGIASYLSLPIKAFPNAVFPIVSVSVGLNGAAASEIENQITRPLESALAGVTNVRHIDSTSALGGSSITITFEYGTDLQKATDDVRSIVDRSRINLPAGIEPPVVQRVEFSSAPIMTYAVSARDMTPGELSWFIDNTLARTLQAVPGVSTVGRVGGINQQIDVTLNPDAMAALGVTAPQINQAITGANLDAGGGRAQIGGQEQTIRILGQAESVAEIRNLTIPVNGRFVKLSDVAQVNEGASEERAFARLNGRPVVGFSVTKTNDSSDVDVEDGVIAQLETMKTTYPNVQISKIFSTVDQTRESFISTQHVLLEGMLLASIVVFIFLRDWRATLITALAMPLSLVPTFAVMAMFGFTLNIITLLALTLVIGILVDDAIVEIENIQKRIEQGQTPYRASLIGADAIGLAVIATTATIISVFAPVSVMPGSIGQFFREFGITVSVAVLFSLLVARLLTPLMAAYFLKPSKHPEPRKPFEGRYRRALDMALDHPWISAFVGGFLVVISMVAFIMFVPFGFQPADDSGLFYQTLEGPPGVSKQDMDLAVTRATRIIMAHEEVKSVFAQVGSSVDSGFGGGGVAGLGNATLTVELHDNRGMTTREFRQSIQPELKAIPDIRVASLGDFGTADVQIILQGDDDKLLEQTQLTLMQQMRGVDQVANIRPSPAAPGPQLVIRPKPDEAARLGVTAQNIAQVVRIATVGDIDAQSSKFSQGERRTPIRVRLPQTAQTDLNIISQLRVPTGTGGLVPLSSVADIAFEQGPGQTNRRDRKRQVTVQADLAGAATSTTATAAVMQLPIMQNLPDGITQSPAGDQEDMIELFTNFIIALITGITLVYVVLILLFKSFFKAITIIAALPLVMVGVAVSLIVTGIDATMPVFIGLLMLFGLAGKNSILLVELAIECERAGMTRLEALHEACRERARPIIMTTLAMIAGMLPTALGIGEGASWRQPMAVAVIGGLISSTAISLVLVPAIYEIVDKFENWLKPKFSGLITKKAPGDDDPIVEEA